MIYVPSAQFYSHYFQHFLTLFLLYRCHRAWCSTGKLMVDSKLVISPSTAEIFETKAKMINNALYKRK